MKDKSSTATEMINRNWVLKRKRRKLPCASNLSNGKEENSALSESLKNTFTAKHKLKSESSSERSPTKKKGHDGYYYECVICDVGGELLCCDSCPRTYHIECLDPPLKRVPTGKWQCPKCCQKSDSLEPVSHLDSISKRARTKVIMSRSRSGDKLSGAEKVSRIFESSVLARRKSSFKGKYALDHSRKPRNSSFGDSVEGSGSFVNVNDKNSHDESPAGFVALRNSDSPSKGVPSPSILGKLDPSDEASEGKPSDLAKLESIDGASKGTSNCEVGSSGKQVVTSCGDDDGTEMPRKKNKFSSEGCRKKCRTDKGKSEASISVKHASKVNNGSSGKVSKKRKAVDRGVLSSSSKDSRTKGLDTRRKKEKFSGQQPPQENDSNKAGVPMDETRTWVDNETGDFLQVDRVLGCRIKGDNTNSSCHTSTTVIDDLPSDEMVVAENQNRPSKEKSTDDSIPDVGGSKISTHSNQNSSSFDGAKSAKNDIMVDEMHVYQRSLTKKCKGGTVVDSQSKEFNCMDLTALTGEDVNESTVISENLEKAEEQMVTEGGTDVSLRSHCGSEDPKVSKAYVSNENGDTKDTHKEVGVSNSSENKAQVQPSSEVACGDKELGSYEFLVKWVGKSHIHNTWISEAELKILAKRKLENYKAKYGTSVINICEEQWKHPQRILALRASKNGAKEAFIKWTGLPYDECTWERLDEPVVKDSSHLIDLYGQFEHRAFENDASEDDSLRGKGASQQSEIVILTEQPKELKGGSLFPHQLEALNWLRKCWYKSKNVILADEMGLGKTVSACAFISSLYFEFKATLPCLVLVPLSTMPNWLAEFALWAPDLNVVEYHGCAKARAIIRQHEWHASHPTELNKKTASYKFHVLLTTYEMVLADSSHLRGVPWEVLVVDEGHRLKNSESKLFSLLNTFSFQHRVLLTGTPLQNNIGEMYNLLNFLQPASFPSLSSFEEKFKDLATAEKVEELKKLVAPHMLRRLKKDAMQNIPPKTERMVPVELSSVQAEYYRAMLTKNYQILRNIGKGVAQQSMLNIVMQLRKVCNHPYLIPGTEPESGSAEFLHEMRIKASAKLTLLHSMLKALHREGHRVLIFSQMTKLLDILEDYLTIEFGPKTYERVDGSVSVADRQAAIARFNQDKSRFVFLLSTRSCGLGINLATADTVIIYDSDFNPHADIQAMNRAHRIGQSNRLLVYRLVVRASVEERILQLAKKKLMLDQLFVNKSGSQKEVEDILRWGTEELFGDSSSTSEKDTGGNNKDEAITDTEHKHRKRSGGLGDVYKDKCAEGGNKIVWDEGAILKLLDRSNLQSGSGDAAEGDLENDMLGSVKSVEWNDETIEEQGGDEALPVVIDETCPENAEKKENVLTGTEENEWDRLLRVRWEKYQSEEEAALGRGKRQRKAVSYRETFTSHPSETLSESAGEEEREPEPEPEREYTSAGRAHKEKYAKLRGRQKDRIARRNTMVYSCASERVCGPESQIRCLSMETKDADRATHSDNLVREKPLAIDLEDNISVELSDPPSSKIDLTSKMARQTKRQKLKGHLDLSINSIGHPCSGQFHPTDSHFSSTSSNLLPVLGLYAPNADPSDSSRRNFKRSADRQSRSRSSVDRQIRPGTGWGFPFSLPPPASSSGTKGEETAPDKLKSPEASSSVQKQQQHLRSSIPDNCLPINLYPPGLLQGREPDLVTTSGSGSSKFREKLGLPKLPFDENLLPKFPLPARSIPNTHHEFSPSFALGSRHEAIANSMQEHPMVPLLPKLKFPSLDGPMYNQEREMHPTLGLGQMPTPLSSFPEKHKKVLENIMLRTGTGSSNMFRRKSKVDGWSEDELDCLWIGVRRHGRGNWDCMLRDPRLRFSKYKTAEDLAARWEEEQNKIFEVPKLAKSTKLTKSPVFPGISDGMMARALHGSRLIAPLKFHSHLTDMKLGLSDGPSDMPHFESEQCGLRNDNFVPVPMWNSETNPANFAKDSTGRPPERLGTSSNVPVEKPLLPSSLGTVDLGSIGPYSSNSYVAQLKEDASSNKYGKFPSILDGSLNVACDSHSNLNGESTSSVLPVHSKGMDISHEEGVGSTSKDKLPHWLREAVNTPAKPPAPELLHTVSAIAQSVRLIYGEENPTIPPFVIPYPPPPEPKDPRQSLKKKKKHRSQMFKGAFPNIFGSGQNVQGSLHKDDTASSSNLMAPPCPQLPQSLQASGRPLAESDLNLPPFSTSNSPKNPSVPKKSSMGLSPSPEVLQLVASCVAPGPHTSSVSGLTTTSFLESKILLPKSLEGGFQELNRGTGNSTAREILPVDAQGPGRTPEHPDSDDSSKTESDHPCTEQPDVDEVSSEETLSDHPANDREL